MSSGEGHPWLRRLVRSNQSPQPMNFTERLVIANMQTKRSEATRLRGTRVEAYKQDMAPSIPTRHSPLQRGQRVYPLTMIEEGQEILLALASLRFATGSQIQRIIFDRTAVSPRMARHRATRSLRRLFDAGYLRRVSVFAPSSTGRMSMQIVNVLSASGARVIGLDPRWVRTRAPKDGQVLTHDFWLVELGVLAMEGCPKGLAITTWWDDRLLSGRKRQGSFSLATIPDGLLIVQQLGTGKLFPSFLELDLGTESVVGTSSGRRDFARKIEGYLAYTPASFAEEFGISAAPIVLTVTESEWRMGSLMEVTVRLGGGGRFWFSTLDRLRNNVGSDHAQAGADSARYGPFWTSNWQTSLHDGWRSFAARCGV
jgi:hypothetical protein